MSFHLHKPTIKLNLNWQIFKRLFIISFIANIVWMLCGGFLLWLLGYVGVIVFFSVIPGIVYGICGGLVIYKEKEKEFMPSKLALQKAAQAWCNKKTKNKVMDAVLAESFAEILDVFLDSEEIAWGIIANVGEGDWKKQPLTWQAAAAKWRDNWLSITYLKEKCGLLKNKGEAIERS